MNIVRPVGKSEGVAKISGRIRFSPVVLMSPVLLSCYYGVSQQQGVPSSMQHHS